ncbi:hypothetical protein ASE40_19670 [Flavobacterium sp. Root935]|jgi:hypothetical protein|uniref:DUF4129 domain-containing protein n=1 Tax=unclassified Flavobacterium TaxID=196869 RepID=UPI00070DB110|nr:MULTISPECIES: DUF4129 domain-containing protein [unclassified Flavobacterium]KRD58547.1 hypothetical protein ASE40_19670 [Flavobacterium sp. Root935]MDQ1164819.1 hypothetical protein [Flavobacterium sp. SORGH_AS_0622]
MTRLLFILSFLFCCGVSKAQDSIVIPQDPPKIAGIKYTEKDIQIDSNSVEAKHFEKNFKKKYTDPEFIYEYKAPEKSWWDHFMHWLAGVFASLFNFKSVKTSLTFVGILFRILAVLIVIVLIYLIARSLTKQDGRWIFGKNANKKAIFYSDAEKNIHLLDFEKLIKESIEAGERRIAVRYYYLWLLKVMAQHNYIEWDIEKTNSDYLYELQQPAHKEEFTYLSYLYNYIWYGEFEIDDAIFQKTENRFKKALKTFGNG